MSFSAILAGLIFGLIGFAAFIYGKKQASWRAMGIGIALMAYPYFISNVIALYATGAVLTACLFVFRE